MSMNSENEMRSSCRFVEALISTSCRKLFMCAEKFLIARQRSRNSACYGWTVRGSKLGGGKGFPLLRVRPDTQPLVQRVPGLFTRGKAAVSTEVKQRRPLLTSIIIHLEGKESQVPLS